MFEGKNKIYFFLLALFIQILIIGGLFSYKYLILIKGKEILLKIEPIDPRALLRGDYLYFQYEISRLPVSYFSYQPQIGDIVYVPLKREGKFWKATRGIKNKKPQEFEFKDKIFIKGKVKMKSISYVYLEYGIEQYFIPEGAGKNLRWWRHKISAKVKVDRQGNAVLKQIYVDNKPWP